VLQTSFTIISELHRECPDPGYISHLARAALTLGPTSDLYPGRVIISPSSGKVLIMRDLPGQIILTRLNQRSRPILDGKSHVAQSGALRATFSKNDNQGLRIVPYLEERSCISLSLQIFTLTLQVRCNMRLANQISAYVDTYFTTKYVYFIQHYAGTDGPLSLR
jgi:hypothetical protein